MTQPTYDYIDGIPYLDPDALFEATNYSRVLAEAVASRPGQPGPANTLAIGTVQVGATAAATITGTAPNQTLNLTLPEGDPNGPPGPANTLTVGTVTTGAPGSDAAVTITGTAPNQTLNLTIPKGDPGAGPDVEDLRAFVDARIAVRGGVIDANAHGVVADGETDDTAAWNALVQSAPAGAILTWTGRSMLKSGSIIWKTKLSLIGKGWGQSVLAMESPADVPPWSAIDFTPATMGASKQNPVEDCTFSDFEIDGSGLGWETRHISGKGIFGQFMRRCRFERLYIHDTIGTGLGTDYMPDCLIHGVLAINCGRNWYNGGGGGQAGIGIGTGAWETEMLTISDCITISTDPARPAHWGVFVEWQDGQPYRGRGTRIIGCSAYGADCGFGDRGTAGTQMIGNTAIGCRDGFHMANGTIDSLMVGNVARNNTGDGFSVDPAVQGGHTFRDNKSHSNGKRGLYISATTNQLPHITIEGNEFYDNGESGVQLQSSVSGGGLPGLTVRNNKAWNNGRANGNAFTTRGIRIDANLDRFDLSGNVCYDSQTTPTQQVGLNFGAFTYTNGRISNNMLAGNGSGNALSAMTLAGTRSNVGIRDNIGWRTEADGSATIAAGAASVTVTHGLAGTPTAVTLAPRGDGRAWVSARTSSQFTITRADTTGALDVDWAATHRPAGAS